MKRNLVVTLLLLTALAATAAFLHGCGHGQSCQVVTFHGGTS